MGLLAAMRFSSRAKPQSLFQFSRRITTTTDSAPMSVWLAGAWDPNNRIRVAGAIFGVIGAAGMLFDTFYRRATKQELNQAMEKFDAKFDAKFSILDAKIDGLINALLNSSNTLSHVYQRDKIAAETENRELRRENERLKAGNGTSPISLNGVA